jgi:hypothetical protein
VLDEVATFHHGHLGDAIAHLHTHHVAANGTAIALATLTALDNLSFDGCLVALLTTSATRSRLATTTTAALLLG